MAYEVPEVLRTLRQSDIGTMLGCGRKLYLSKVEGLPRDATRKMLVGTAYHAAMEVIYRTIKLGETLDVAEAKARAIESIQVNFALAKPEDLELEAGETVMDATLNSGGIIVQAVDYYMDHLFPEIIAAGTPVIVEEKAEFDYRGFHLHGTIDLIDGDAVLRDHKFSGSYLSKTGWPDSYLSQLSRYAWFLEMIEAPVLDLKLDMVSYAKATRKKDPCYEHHTYTLAEAGLDLKTLTRMGRESVDNALDMIEAGIFPRTGANVFGLGCGNCPYKGAACAGCASSASTASAA